MYIYIYIDYSGVSDIGEQILIIQALLIVVDFVCFDFQRFSTNGSVYSKPEKTQKKQAVHPRLWSKSWPIGHHDTTAVLSNMESKDVQKTMEWTLSFMFLYEISGISGGELGAT